MKHIFRVQLNTNSTSNIQFAGGEAEQIEDILICLTFWEILLLLAESCSVEKVRRTKPGRNCGLAVLF